MRALIAAAAILFTSSAPVAQDNDEFILPDLDLGADAMLMAENVNVAAKVTFIAPTGIGADRALQIGATDTDLAFRNSVTIPAEGPAGGSKTDTTRPGTKTAASLSLRTAPGQPISIQIDDVVTAEGFALADFRCNFNAGGEMACEGAGFSGSSKASGTLLVGATLIAKGNGISGPVDGRFDVTISYQ